MPLYMSVLAQIQDTTNGGGLIANLLPLALIVMAIAGMWATFSKASEPGWASIIPIYNAIVLLRIAGKPWWWVLLLLIPFVNILVAIHVSIDLAKNFGKGVGFGFGLVFLGFIFYPILGFGNARYQKVV